MSDSAIVNLRQVLKGHPDLHSLRMTYEDGGAVEVWTTPTRTVRVKGGAKPHEIKAAFEAAYE